VENSSVGKVHYLKSIETEAKKYWGNQASVVIDVCSSLLSDQGFGFSGGTKWVAHDRSKIS
jgi:hypothetical protein